MYCIKCGNKNDDDSRFCTKCGTNLQNDININITNTNKNAKKDIGIFHKFEKINIKNRNMVIFIVTVIIILAAYVFFQNIINNNNTDNGSDKNIDDDIYINESQAVQYQDTAEIFISSIPSGADIYIDNISRGKTPAVINLPKGSYSLKLDLKGYKKPITDLNVTMKSGYETIMNVNATLEPINE